MDGGVPRDTRGLFSSRLGGGYTPFVTAGRDLPPGRHRRDVLPCSTNKAEESPGHAFEIHAI